MAGIATGAVALVAAGPVAALAAAGLAGGAAMKYLDTSKVSIPFKIKPESPVFSCLHWVQLHAVLESCCQAGALSQSCR